MKRITNKQISLIVALIAALATVFSAIIMKLPFGADDKPSRDIELFKEIQRLRMEVIKALPKPPKMASFDQQRYFEVAHIGSIIGAIRNITEAFDPAETSSSPDGSLIVSSTSKTYPPSVSIQSQTVIRDFAVQHDVIVFTLLDTKKTGITERFRILDFEVNEFPEQISYLQFESCINHSRFYVMGSNVASDGTVEVTVTYQARSLDGLTDNARLAIRKHSGNYGFGIIDADRLTITATGIVALREQIFHSKPLN